MAAGGLIGLERQQDQAGSLKPSIGGVRTFPLIALAGCALSTHFTQNGGVAYFGGDTRRGDFPGGVIFQRLVSEYPVGAHNSHCSTHYLFSWSAGPSSRSAIRHRTTIHVDCGMCGSRDGSPFVQGTPSPSHPTCF
ncbi:MAG: MgtC/SapB family protein [Nitrospinae bacterium]|nr:MgtC/SapB family protein [Nitrospinota bacterium]